MPRTAKSDMFFIQVPRPSREHKGERLMGVNERYSEKDNITLQHLIDFLRNNNVDPSKVRLPEMFMAWIGRDAKKAKRFKVRSQLASDIGESRT